MLAVQLRSTECADAATPVPDIGIVKGVLLATVTEPVTAPAVVGEKLKLPVTDWDGFSVKGVVIGNMLKPAPVTVIWLTVIELVEELVTVTF